MMQREEDRELRAQLAFVVPQLAFVVSQLAFVVPQLGFFCATASICCAKTSICCATASICCATSSECNETEQNVERQSFSCAWISTNQYQAVRTYRSHLLTSELIGREWPASGSGRFKPAERTTLHCGEEKRFLFPVSNRITVVRDNTNNLSEL